MTLTANEQYFLELVNRARLDPLAEAARYGIDLNKNLAPGTLNGSARQVLAADDDLDQAAGAHSAWMLQTDIFSHTGVNGTDPGQRMTSAGYVFAGSWTWGENIAWSGTTGSVNLTAAIDGHHAGLFDSAGHRQNILNNGFREVGIGQEQGQFTYNGTTYNASMATQAFARTGTAVFLTGVAYNDANGNDFYTVGEATAGTTFAIGVASDVTEAAGGYGVATAAAAGVAVQITQGAQVSQVVVDLSAGNVKLDLVSGTEFHTSGGLQLLSGVADARLLGVAALRLTGNSAANALTGNSGANVIRGAGGSDGLAGAGGADNLRGAGGFDRLDGGAGNDCIFGGLHGDTFVFADGSGRDRVMDFSVAEADRIALDDGLWGGAVMTGAQVVASFATVVGGTIVLGFGGGDVLNLDGFVDTVGLAGLIDFF